LAIGKKKAKSIMRRYKHLVRRYEAYRVKHRVRVPEKYFRMIEDEREAKKMPEYADLLDEDAPEEDEEIVKDVWEDDGTEKPAKPEPAAKPEAAAKPAAGAAAAKPAAAKPADAKKPEAKKPELAKKPDPKKK
jgi:hypothetical protein